MTADSTERFIRDAAELGWSRHEVCNVLGISWSSLADILDLLGPIQWVPGTKSIARKQRSEACRGIFTDKQRLALEKAYANRKANSMHTVLGVEGTIKELAAHFGIGATTVRRRVQQGLTLELALTTPVHRTAIDDR